MLLLGGEYSELRVLLVKEYVAVILILVTFKTYDLGSDNKMCRPHQHLPMRCYHCNLELTKKDYNDKPVGRRLSEGAVSIFVDILVELTIVNDEYLSIPPTYLQTLRRQCSLVGRRLRGRGSAGD